MFMGPLYVRFVSKMDDDIKDVFNPNIKIYSKKVLYVKDVAQLSSILSSKRLALLLDWVAQDNVSNTAKKLGRKQEAISRDAKLLEEKGLITRTKKGRETFLKTKVKKIIIEFT